MYLLQSAELCLTKNKKKLFTFLGVIPARAGSTGIKNKNIIKINGKPLINYTFDSIKKSKLKKNFLVTDSLKAKTLSKKYGINSNFLRPKFLSKNNTPLHKTLFYFNKWLKLKNLDFDYIVILQPTSPLRSYNDINRSIDIINKKKIKGLFSVSSSLEHPYEQIKGQFNNWSLIIKKASNHTRRQDYNLRPFYINGAIYILHKSLLNGKKVNMKNLNYFVMPKQRSIDIDDYEDVEIAKALLRK